MYSIFTKIWTEAKALWQASPWLTATGWLMIADFMVCLIAMHFDTRQITGVNAWLKPAKFGSIERSHMSHIGTVCRISEGQAENPHLGSQNFRRLPLPIRPFSLENRRCPGALD